MSSGISKNEKEETKQKSSNIFNFWIYLGFILLALIFFTMIGVIIYSLFSSNKKTSSPITESVNLNSVDNSSMSTSFNIKSPQNSSVNNNKPFFKSVINNTDKTYNSIVSPLVYRKIPLKNGGFNLKKIFN